MLYLFHFTAPSPPRNVTAKLIAPGTVEVRWSVPARSNGVIIRFTVYAIPMRTDGPTLRGKRQASTPQTIYKKYRVYRIDRFRDLIMKIS